MAPYANSMGATPASLNSIAAYLSNTNHAHHKNYELTPLRVLGARNVKEFIDHAFTSFSANKKKGKAGRPPKNAGNWIIVRTPEGTFLEPHEMVAYERAVIQAAGLGGPVVGILNWHRNHFSGTDDLNLLSAAFNTEGDIVRDRGTHTIKNLRWIMDQVTDDLNVIRREKGIAPILTMKEIKRERAQQRNERDPVEELAKLPRPPYKTEDLEPALKSLGYKVTRFNPEKDFISCIPPGKKKAKKFRVALLLEEVNAFLEKQKPPQKPREPLKDTFPSPPTDPEKSHLLASEKPVSTCNPKRKKPEGPTEPGGPA